VKRHQPDFNAILVLATITDITPGGKVNNRRYIVLESIDYFVLILVITAYLGWLLQGEHNIKSPDSQAGD
jgi:hypothetical protein